MKKQNHFTPAIKCGKPNLPDGSLQYDLLYVSSPKESVNALKKPADRCLFFQEAVEEITALAVCHNPCVECRSYNSAGHQQQGYVDAPQSASDMLG